MKIPGQSLPFAVLFFCAALLCGCGNSSTLITTPTSTTTTLTGSATTVTSGASITLTATISPSTATGTVTFYDGAATLGTGTITSGVATLSTSALAVGIHSVTATYPGSGSTYSASTSLALSITVAAIPTTTTLTASATSVTAGTSILFTATVLPSAATGIVTFYDGSTALGTGTLSAGVATFSTSTLAGGTHTITAVTPAGATYASSTSARLVVTVIVAYSGPTITGKVFSGAAPVNGASVQFYAAGTSGNGIVGPTLNTTAILTDSSGSFTIPTGYSCPLPTTQVYLVATGGVTTSAPNTARVLLTALGSCNALTGSVTINEVTTAAAAWPLAQFLSAGGAIGATVTNTTGLANAFRIAASLANTTTGASPGATYPSNASSVTARINSLANLLNTCGASSSACSPLFAATVGSPTNTLDAALSVVKNPARNAAALFSLSLNSAAFTPALTSAPPDWTLFTVLSGGGLNGASTLGILSTGNVWVANYYGGVASQFTPLGAPVFANGVPGPGLNSSYGLAVDQADNAWIPNDVFGGSVTKISADGATTTAFTGSGMEYPVFTAIDTDNSVWVADYGNATLSHLSNSGAPLSGASGYQKAELAFPTALAIDANHNVWANDLSDYTITRINPDGTNPIQVRCCNGPTTIAVDQRGIVWAGNFYGSTLSQVSATGTVLATGISGGGMVAPQALAIDATGNVWVASFHAVGISEFSGSQSATPGTPLSPGNGFAPDGPIAGAYSIAIDASGNVWVANFNTSNVIRYLGLAAPTKSPTIGPAQTP